MTESHWQRFSFTCPGREHGNSGNLKHMELKTLFVLSLNPANPACSLKLLKLKGGDRQRGMNGIQQPDLALVVNVQCI
jgi:hypothetical protein